MRRWKLLAALLAVGVLAGCVSIPTSGAVQSAQIDAEPDDPSSLFLVERPRAGQTMSEVLSGFIRAGRGPQNDYSIAKEYLAPGTSWSGTERVLVASTIGTPVEVDDDTFAVTVTVIAEVDERGQYVSLPLATTQTLEFDFMQVGDEYRIVDPPAGTVLTPNGFGDTFRSYALYFFDPSFRYLVPEVHWFPSSRVASRIVEELVGGQGEWLQAGVLQSAFPPGTTARATLDAPGVDVSLGADVRAESGLAQLRMLQQLRASLTSIANVSASEVRVTADGFALAPAAEENVPESRLAVSVPFGGSEGAIGTLSVDGVVPLTAIGSRADGLDAVAASLARDRSALAVLGSAGVSLVGSSEGPVVIDTRPGLIAPSLDPFGYVWSVPADDPAALVATGRDGVPHLVPLAADGRVVAIELSRDGSRLLVALDTEEGSRLFTVGVLRDAELTPVGLHTPFDLKVTGAVSDVAWVDGERVAVLSRDGEESRVQVLPLGGPVVDLGEIEDAAAIVGGNLQDGIRVLTSTGQVLRPTSVGGWSETGLTASFLGTQQ